MFLVGDVRIDQDGIVPSVRTLTNANAFDVAVVDANGDHVTGFDPSKPSTATLTQVTNSASSVSLLASNTARRSFVIYNDANRDMVVAFSATATLTAFTVRIASKGTFMYATPAYTGVVSGIWTASGSGSAQITSIS